MTAQPLTGAPRAKPRILLVDDAEEICMMIEAILHHYGYEVLCASSGEQALNLLRAQPAELALVDILMPGKNGWELITELFREYPDIRIVAMSGGFHGDDTQTAQLAKTVGVHGTLRKPFLPDQLIKVIREAMEPSPHPS